MLNANDGSKNPPRFFLVQAMWGLVAYPSASEEWGLEKKLDSVSAAGFDAIDLDIPYVVGKERYWESILEKYRLALGLQGPVVHTLEKLRKCIEYVQRMRSPYLDAQIGNAFVPPDDAVALLRSMVERAKDSSIALMVQTHRGRITQDLLLTKRFCEEIPELRLNLDLSHYFVAGEWGSEPLPEPASAALDPLLCATAMIDARVSNGEQIQIDIDEGSGHLGNFERLWKRAISLWVKDAREGDLFIFRPELGPPPYSQVDLSGREISDRWEQAKILARVGVRIWNEAVQELGKGQLRNSV